MTRTVLRPEPGPAREYHFPRFERRRLENGLTILVAPVTKLPVVTVLAVVEAGAVADPVGREGVAQIAAAALTEGIDEMDGEALTDRLERLGTSVDASADWDATVVNMTVLSDRLAEAFPLMARVLTTPTFPARELERLRGDRIAELLQIESEPRALANQMFSRFLYADGSRYALPAGGSRESVARIMRDDVLALYGARYRPGGTTIIVAGDVSADRAVQMVSRELGGWRGEQPPRAVVNDAPARHERSFEIVERADAPQSELRVGQVGVPRTHPDYFDIVVMNAVLGGLFSSRINLNLREEHGYTYGASSYFDWRRGAGPFVIATAVASDATADALREVLREVTRMRTEEISEDELTLATSYLEGVFPIRYETTSAIASALANLAIYDLPEDWFDSYRGRIGAVTKAGVLEAARKYLDPERLQILVVGDAAEVEQKIREVL